MPQVEKPGQYKCSMCNATFDSERDRQEHLRIYHGAKAAGDTEPRSDTAHSKQELS